jgi:hypothetical protein
MYIRQDPIPSSREKRGSYDQTTGAEGDYWNALNRELFGVSANETNYGS